MNLTLSIELAGLTVHKHPALPYSECWVMGDRIYLDDIGYRMIERGDDPREVLAGYTIRILPAMGEGLHLETKDVFDST